MKPEKLIDTVSRIVFDAHLMWRKHAPDYTGKVGYCCIFSQSFDQYNDLEQSVREIGTVAQDTATGFTYVIPNITTPAGILRVLKIRKPDPTRTERGDADFSINNYHEFKNHVLSRPGFSLIRRPKTEMIELIDNNFDVRAYFSYPPVETHDGIKEALERH